MASEQNDGTFRSALYGNEFKCSFGNLDQFLDDLTSLRSAVAGQFAELSASREACAALLEEQRLVREMFELSVGVDLVDGLQRLADRHNEETEARDMRIGKLSAALACFALAGEGPFSMCDPSDEFFSDEDENGTPVVICYRDFHAAVKALDKWGISE